MTPVDAQQHEERDPLRPGGRHRPDPATLAEPPETEPIDVECVGESDCVVRLELETAARRLAGRFALAAPVEGEHADARRRKDVVQAAVQKPLARSLVGAVDCDDGYRTCS